MVFEEHDLKITYQCDPGDLPPIMSTMHLYLHSLRGHAEHDFERHVEFDMPEYSDRTNDGPLRDFEKDVCNRTTMRFFYPESAPHDPTVNNEPDILMVVIPFKPIDLIWLGNILFERSRKGFWKSPPLIWLANKSNFRFLDPFFMRNTATQLLWAAFRSKKNDNSVHDVSFVAKALKRLEDSGAIVYLHSH